MKQETGRIDRFFQVSQNHSSVRTEVLAGITTFITIAYILILNPQILADPYVIMGDAAMAGKIANGVFIGTCIGAFIGTLLCALYARVPFAQAPGMGLNAFFAYTVVLGMGYTYGQALVVVFISGVFFIVITAIGLREAIIRSIPDAVKTAITPGIGLFITIIGLKNAGIVISNPATLGIVAATLIGIPLGVTHISNLDMNIGMKFRDFAEVSFVKMDFAGLFSGANMVETIFTVTMLVISFSLVNMFDSIGTLLGAAKQSGMIDENGEVIRMKQALMSDAISTAAGAMVGTSTVTTVVESSAGIAAGGRTGLTSLVTALMFLGAILFAPIVSIVPAAATAPALIFVGILMLGNIRDVDFSDMSNALPAFCTIVFMPFTYSIANGVAFGLITYCLMKLTTGRRQDVKVLTLAISVVFVVRYAFMTLG